MLYREVAMQVVRCGPSMAEHVILTVPQYRALVVVLVAAQYDRTRAEPPEDGHTASCVQSNRTVCAQPWAVRVNAQALTRLISDQLVVLWYNADTRNWRVTPSLRAMTARAESVELAAAVVRGLAALRDVPE